VTRYGTQPILAVLVLNDLSVSRVARAVGVPQRTLSRYVMGATRPHPEVVRRLVVCLDRPAELLFTSDALAASPYRGPELNLTVTARVPGRLVRYVHKPTNG
jgi:transcriptional regulator with XRE-family HTH domain